MPIKISLSQIGTSVKKGELDEALDHFEVSSVDEGPSPFADAIRQIGYRQTLTPRGPGGMLKQIPDERVRN